MIHRRLRLPPEPRGWRRHARTVARWLHRVAWWLEARAVAGPKDESGTPAR